MKRIAIIGGGFCGTLIATHLVRLAQHPLHITLIEKSEKLHRGIAYATFDPYHLLNIPADKMGAFPETPEHFYQWVIAHEEEWRKHNPFFQDFIINPTAFLPRQLYGLYLDALWRDTVHEAKTKHIILEIIKSEIEDLSLLSSGQIQLMISKGAFIFADSVVLALGVPSNRLFKGETSDKYFASIWNSDVDMLWKDIETGKLGVNSRIILLGSGLTMLDGFASLFQRGYQGEIAVISPHHRLPEVHNEEINPYPLFIDPLNTPKTILELFKIFRKELAKSKLENRDWREVFDAIRPVIPEVWKQLSWHEKSRFVRHLLSLWNRHRHRMPSYYFEKIIDAFLNSKLNLLAGYVISVDQSKQEFVNVSYKSDDENQINEIEGDYVINCSGPDMNILRSSSKLIQNLYKKEWIIPDPLQLGIQADADGRVKGFNNGKIYAVGQILYGERLETTSVPEIRLHCQRLAEYLLSH